jgi:photosystem II stability/assembly factor-like uncharacterized protein
MKKIIYTIVGLMLSFNFLSAQVDQNDLWLSPSREYNFYDIQKSFNDYWNDKNINHETPKEDRLGWKQFKRWEWFWEQRVYPTGEFPPRGHVFEEYLEYQKKNKSNKKDKTQNTEWNFLGPSSAPGGYEGMGRLNCVIEHPDYNGTTNQTIWVGSASGGIWKTTNDGSTWTSNTDELAVLGMGDLVIDPIDSDIMYAATGDGDGYDTFSIGILKSTDAGATWNTTAFQVQVNQTYVCRRIVMNPDDSDELFVATNGGLYRTTNAGSNWTQSISGSFWDVKFHPTDSDIIYAAKGNEFYRSTDGGDNFTYISTGLPTNSIRYTIAVTPDEEDYVYLLSSNSSRAFNGVYRSTNAGQSFTTRSTTPNLLNSSFDGSGTGGQGNYDLSMAIDPNDAETVIVGGVNLWKSTDGGANWEIKGYWTNSSVEEVHADHHMLYWPVAGRLYSAHDGGLDISTDDGETWEYIGSGLEITQFYRISVSQTNADLILCGAQDNSSFLKTSSTFGMTRATGDGMEQAINPEDEDIMYTASYYGKIYKSTNGGDSWFVSNYPDENGAWVTPYQIDPNNSDQLFAGYLRVWKSTNGGGSWTAISSFTNESALTFLHVAPENSDFIYTGRNGALWKTTNGGSSWTSLTIPSTNAIKSIVTNPDDADEVWICFSGYTSGQKVYHSTNGGTSWTNISGTLPNVPCNVVTYQKDVDDRIWVGTDIGVWYRGDDDSDWEEFNDELPNVICNDLEIYEAGDKLRLGTYGRGLWEVDLPTNRPGTPELSSPTDESTDQSTTLTLSWNSVDNVDSYDLQVSTSDDFATTVVDVNTTSTSYEVTGLNYNDEYFWRVRSLDEDIESNWSDVWSFSTTGNPNSCELLFEGFEDTSIPSGWDMIYVDGDIDWSFGVSGGYDGNPSLAYDGNYNARFFYDFWDVSTQLITPLIEIGSCSDNLMLEFYEARVAWYGDIDELYIKYKYADDEDWTLLESFTEEAADWTLREVDLSSISDDFYICFEAYGNYGFGACIDNVFIYGSGTSVQLSAPTLVSPTNNATDQNTSLTLDWDAVTGATSYDVQLSTSSNFTTTIVNQSTTNTYLDVTGLSENTEYFWRVRAEDDDSESDWSAVWSFETLNPVLDPPDLVSPADNATDQNTSLTLDWEVVTGATSYDVQLSTSSNFTTTIVNQSTTNTYLDVTGLSENTEYFWRVRAEDDDSESDWSAVWSFETLNPVLDPPDLVSPADNATDQNTSLTLDWDAVTGATSYDVQLSTSSNFTTTIVNQSTTNTYLDVTGLSENTEYFWRVRAEDDDSESDWSAVWSFETLNPVLDPPDLVSPADNATDQNTSLTLDWDAVTGATSYDVQVSTSSNFTTTIINQSTTDTYFGVTGLSENTEYFWRVRAEDDDTESDWSAVWSFTTLNPVLDPPDLVSPADNATDQNTSLTLDWDAVTGATSYDVQVSTSSNFTTTIINQSTTDTYFGVTGLSENTEYFWRVRAEDDDSESDWSAVWSFETLNPVLDPPDLVSPADNATDQNTSLTLDWDAVTGATSYDVQVSTSSNFTTTIINQSTTDTYFGVTGLSENTEFFWRVRAEDDDSESDWSAVWSFETGETQIQECPWTFTDETGNNATIIVLTSIEPTIGNRAFADGDAIGAFFTDGDEQICAGFSVWDGNNMGITVWGDDTYTDEKDGFATNEDYVLKAWDAQNGETLDGIYTVDSGPDNYSADALTYLASFTTASDQTHSIELPSGWSMISTYIEPENTDIEDLLSDIEDDLLIMKNAAGNIYMPSLSINNINNWSMDEGYKFYMTSANTLDITGQLIDPTSYTFELNSGWHIVSYLRNSSMDIEDALDDITTNMLICKNAQGNIYMPSLGINNIDQMITGQGYQIYMTSYDELTYPANNSPRKSNIENRVLTPPAELLLPEVKQTGYNMTLIIYTQELVDGSEIGIWTSDNVLVGSGKVHEGKAAITVWGDNEQTKQIDGARQLESLKAMVFDKETAMSKEIELSNVHSLMTSQNHEYLAYSTEDIVMAKAVSPSINNSDDLLLSCKPNPTTGETVIEYQVNDGFHVSIKLYSMSGQLIQTITDSDATNGLHTLNFDGSRLANGVYNLQMIVDGKNVNRLLVISK